jgi:hypothetical protein
VSIVIGFLVLINYLDARGELSDLTLILLTLAVVVLIGLIGKKRINQNLTIIPAEHEI